MRLAILALTVLTGAMMNSMGAEPPAAPTAKPVDHHPAKAVDTRQFVVRCEFDADDESAETQRFAAPKIVVTAGRAATCAIQSERAFVTGIRSLGPEKSEPVVTVLSEGAAVKVVVTPLTATQVQLDATIEQTTIHDAALANKCCGAESKCCAETCESTRKCCAETCESTRKCCCETATCSTLLTKDDKSGLWKEQSCCTEERCCDPTECCPREKCCTDAKCSTSEKTCAKTKCGEPCGKSCTCNPCVCDPCNCKPCSGACPCPRSTTVDDVQVQSPQSCTRSCRIVRVIELGKSMQFACNAKSCQANSPTMVTLTVEAVDADEAAITPIAAVVPASDRAAEEGPFYPVVYHVVDLLEPHVAAKPVEELDASDFVPIIDTVIREAPVTWPKDAAIRPIIANRSLVIVQSQAAHEILADFLRDKRGYVAEVKKLLR